MHFFGRRWSLKHDLDAKALVKTARLGKVDAIAWHEQARFGCVL